MGRVTRALAKLRRDWTVLAEQDPLWAVWVAPGTRHGGWDTEAFLATGRAEVDDVLRSLDRLGIRPDRRRALDFGCGVGRLAVALARHFDEVVCVDIVRPMLDHAAELAEGCGVRDRLRLVHSEAPDLAFLPDDSVDFGYSSLVLQHLPRRLSVGYLREFVRVARPGGVIVCQVVDRPARSAKGLVARLVPDPLLRVAQRALLGYPAPMRMAALRRADVQRALDGTDARIVDAVVDDRYGGHWIAQRYVITRPS